MKITPIRVAIASMAFLVAGVLVFDWYRTPDYEDHFYEEKPEGAMTVFLVGNSHSRVSYVQQMLERIAHHDDRYPPLWIDGFLPGGATLYQHVHNDTIQTYTNPGEFDHIVLQGQSLEPLIWPDYYVDSFETLEAQARDKGARPILYQTWPRHPDCDSYHEVFQPPADVAWAHDQKTELAQRALKNNDAAFAPVGPAWESLRTADEPIDLYMPDHNHANRKGAYLIALILYATIIDDELPADPWTPSDLDVDVTTNLVDHARTYVPIDRH